MKFGLKKPCGNCPFIEGTEMVLRPGRMTGIVRSLGNDANTFPCHKTTRFDDDDGEDCATPHSKEQACMGALAFMLKHHGRIPILARLALMSKETTIATIEANFDNITPPGKWRTER